MTTKATVITRPMVTSDFCDADLLICGLYRSMVKMVHAEFSMDASELMTAPQMAARLLKDLGVMPGRVGEMVLEHVGGLDMGVHRTDGTTELFKKLVTVRFSRQLDGLPVEGPGSRIIVRMGSGGELAGLIRRWNEFTSQPLAASDTLGMREIQTLARIARTLRRW